MKSLHYRWAVLVAVVTVWHGSAAGQPPGRDGGPRGPAPPGAGFGGLRFPLLDALDTDGDGKLSREEIENAPRALAALDRDGDGKLSREEIGWPPVGFGPGGRWGPGRGWGPPGGGPGFPQGGPGFGPWGGGAPPGGAETPEAALPVAERVERLMAYDRDGDGRLTKAELPRRRHAILDEADANQDGAVDREELTRYFGRQQPDGADPQPPE